MNYTINDTIVYHFHFKCWCSINLGPIEYGPQVHIEWIFVEL